MAEQQIVATKEIGGEKKQVAINYDFGADLAEAVEKFGEAVVFTSFKSKAVITAQAAIRRYMEAGKNQDEIATLMASWKPGVAIERQIDTTAAFLANWDKLDPEKQQEILSQLKGKKK